MCSLDEHERSKGFTKTALTEIEYRTCSHMQNTPKCHDSYGNHIPYWRIIMAYYTNWPAHAKCSWYNNAAHALWYIYAHKYIHHRYCGITT